MFTRRTATLYLCQWSVTSGLTQLVPFLMCTQLALTLYTSNFVNTHIQRFSKGLAESHAEWVLQSEVPSTLSSPLPPRHDAELSDHFINGWANFLTVTSGSAFHPLSAMNNAHCLAIVRSTSAKRNRYSRSFSRHLNMWSMIQLAFA